MRVLWAGVSFQHSCNTFLTWCFSALTYVFANNVRMSLQQKEKVSIPVLAMMSSTSSHISISNLLRLLRIIFCKASVCRSDGANHIRLSFLEALLPVLENADFDNRDAVFDACKAKAEELGKKNGWLLYPLGIALSGKQRTPGGGTDLACMMGREKTLERVKAAIEKLNG